MSTAIFYYTVSKTISKEEFLKNILAKYSGIKTGQVSFLRTKYGRPYSPQLKKKNIDFNIAHAGNKTVVALSSKCHVGVDMQSIGDIDVESLLDFLSAKEIQELESVKDKKRRLCQIWTIKEACSKAIGKGLGCDFKRIVISTGKTPDSYEVRYGNKRWKAKLFLLQKRYAVAVCFSQEVEDEAVVLHKMDKLRIGL